MSKKWLIRRMPVKTRWCILELRKEKSRDAARSRRGKENYEFYELAKLLPLPAAITSQLDKASIIRLSISYLKLRDFSGLGDPPWNRDHHLHQHHHQKGLKGNPSRRRNHPSITGDLFEAHQGTHILQSLDGFAFILGNDGRFLYISETVSIYLGLSQVEMAGSSVFDYVHHQDHSELAQHLGLSTPQASSSGVPSPGSCDEDSQPSQHCSSPTSADSRGYVMKIDPKQGRHRSFCLRMKSTLTKRGVHVKSSGYRVVQVEGYMRPQLPMGLNGKGAGGGGGGGAGGGGSGSGGAGSTVMGMVGVAIALPPPTITELRLEHDTFITRMSPDFTLSYCEPVIAELMDLSADDVTSRSLYDMCHAGDLAGLRLAHQQVLDKAQVMTDYYRMLTRSGGYVWVQTCATTLLNGKNPEDQNILAINYVLSGVEHPHSILNLWQMCGTDHPTPTPTHPANTTTTTTPTNPVPTSSSSSASLPLYSGHAPKGHVMEDKGNLSPLKGEHQSRKEEEVSSAGEQYPHRSPSPPSSLNLQTHNEADNDVMSDDSNDAGAAAGDGYAEKNEGASGQDCKNSRRKMERPRKRKRGEMETGEGSDMFPDSPNSGGAPIVLKKVEGGTGEETNVGPTTRDTSGTAMTLSSPEDLSLRSSSSSAEAVPKVSCGQPSLSSLPSLPSPSLHSSERDAWAQGGGGGGGSLRTVTPSAVKELEAVMNRHLPFMEAGNLQQQPEASPSPHRLQQNRITNGSYSTTNTYPAHAAKKSTIQWVGSGSQPPASSSSSSSSSSAADPMTASSFLRTLYESRESVIRSCNSAITTTSSNNNNINSSNNHHHHHHHHSQNQVGVLAESGGAPRAMAMYPEDLGPTMLTPPGPADVFKDHPAPFSIPSIVISSPASIHPTASSSSSSASSAKYMSSYGGVMRGGYPGAGLSLSLPCGGGGVGGEAYSMTPPSSVSPQEKLSSPFAAAAAALAYNNDNNNPCSLSRSVMHPSSSSSSSSSSALLSKDLGFHMGGGAHTADYASAKAAYYAMSALSGGHPAHAGGYADVNHNTTAAYDQCARPVIPWY